MVGNFWSGDMWADGLWADGFWADQFAQPPAPTPAGIKSRPQQPYALIELDIPYCKLVYGFAPCMAKLGGTLTINISDVTSVLVPFKGYVLDVTTTTPHNLEAGADVSITGTVGTGDYDIDGVQSVISILSGTKFRIAYPNGFVAPTGSYTSGGTFTTSVLGATGDRKCFNTIRTCQDRVHFDPEDKTLRFCEPTEETLFTLDSQPVVAIPSVSQISVTPSVLRPGVDIGQRESVRIGFKDHPHSDAGLDKYIYERPWDAFSRGTYWGKMRARNRTLEGYPLRVLRGNIGDDLEDAEVYHYVVDSILGQGENVTVSAKDFLILTDDRKAQCPKVSNGLLGKDLDTLDDQVLMTPIGVGDAEYPQQGRVAIGGKEIIRFTRNGDRLLFAERGINGTDISAHEEGDSVQLVKVYDSETPSNIIYNLLTEFCPGVKASWIDASEWDVEVDEYIGRRYSAFIAEPTEVITLINELIEQVGLVFWADPLTNQIKLRSLRPVSPGSTLYSGDHILPGMKINEQTNSRVSAVWTYYGQRNPLEDQDDPSNYKATIATYDSESYRDYPHPAIKKIFSRWIEAHNRAAAARLNAMVLSRYRDPPRKFHFDLFANIPNVPTLAGGVRLDDWVLQDDSGEVVPVPVQIVSIERREDGYTVDAQEAIYREQTDLIEDGVHLIFIDTIVHNINMREMHNDIYISVHAGDTVRMIIGSTAVVGSRDRSEPSLNVGSWPDGVTLELVINKGGRIVGRGGNGGEVPGVAAQSGTTALRVRHPITVTNNGQIAGGGGGGGRGEAVNIAPTGETYMKGGGGGGGAGMIVGLGGGGGNQKGAAVILDPDRNRDGEPGTLTRGGAGGVFITAVATSRGGEGGNLGQDGQPGDAGVAGGPAGLAVDGDSFVTYVTVGNILGGRTG